MSRSFRLGNNTVNYNGPIDEFNDLYNFGIPLLNYCLNDADKATGNVFSKYEHALKLVQSFYMCFEEYYIKSGIYDFSIDKLLHDRRYDNAIEPIYNLALDYENTVAAIEENVELEKERRALRKASRSQIIGGGFGIGGAVKGMLMAGAVNMTTGLAHSTFNMIGNAADSISASHDKDQALKHFNYNYHSRINSCLSRTFLIIIDQLGINFDLQPVKAEKILHNIDSGLLNDDVALLALGQAIEADPYSKDVYLKILELRPQLTKDLATIAEFFKIDIQEEIQEIHTADGIYFENVEDKIFVVNNILSGLHRLQNQYTENENNPLNRKDYFYDTLNFPFVNAILHFLDSIQIGTDKYQLTEYLKNKKLFYTSIQKEMEAIQKECSEIRQLTNDDVFSTDTQTIAAWKTALSGKIYQTEKAMELVNKVEILSSYPQKDYDLYNLLESALPKSENITTINKDNFGIINSKYRTKLNKDEFVLCCMGDGTSESNLILTTRNFYSYGQAHSLADVITLLNIDDYLLLITQPDGVDGISKTLITQINLVKKEVKEELMQQIHAELQTELQAELDEEDDEEYKEEIQKDFDKEVDEKVTKQLLEKLQGTLNRDLKILSQIVTKASRVFLENNLPESSSKFLTYAYYFYHEILPQLNACCDSIDFKKIYDGRNAPLDKSVRDYAGKESYILKYVDNTLITGDEGMALTDKGLLITYQSGLLMKNYAYEWQDLCNATLTAKKSMLQKSLHVNDQKFYLQNSGANVYEWLDCLNKLINVYRNCKSTFPLFLQKIYSLPGFPTEKVLSNERANAVFPTSSIQQLPSSSASETTDSYSTNTAVGQSDQSDTYQNPPAQGASGMFSSLASSFMNSSKSALNKVTDAGSKATSSIFSAAGNIKKSVEPQPSGDTLCPACGASVAAGKKFCGKCGAKIVSKPKILCPSCGSEVEEGKKFCGNCGAQIPVRKKTICPSCGAEVEEGKKFCGMCGAKVTTEQKIICPSCGTEIAAGKKFCGNCGTKV